MATATFYANYGYGTEVRGPYTSNWSNCRGATTGEVAYVSEVASFALAMYSAGIYYLARVFFQFDTSSIGYGSQVTAGTFSYFVNDANIGGFGLVTHSVTGTVGVGNFDDVGSTELTTSRANNPSLSSWDTLTLNSSGLAAINVTGTTLIATRCARDLDNSAPTGTTTGTCDWLNSYANSPTYCTRLELEYTPGVIRHRSRTIHGTRAGSRVAA